MTDIIRAMVARLRVLVADLRYGAILKYQRDGTPGTDNGPVEITLYRKRSQYMARVSVWSGWARPEQSVGLGWRWENEDVCLYSDAVLAHLLSYLSDVYEVDIQHWVGGWQ